MCPFFLHFVSTSLLVCVVIWHATSVFASFVCCMREQTLRSVEHALFRESMFLKCRKCNAYISPTAHALRDRQAVRRQQAAHFPPSQTMSTSQHTEDCGVANFNMRTPWYQQRCFHDLNITRTQSNTILRQIALCIGCGFTVVESAIEWESRNR